MRRFRDRADGPARQVGLADRAGVLAGTLAYGRKRALELALALALDPKVLLLDEPTAGHGPGGRRPHRRADRAGPQRAHRRDGRAQHERRRPARRPGHRAAGRRGAGRGPVRAGPRRRAGHHRLPGQRSRAEPTRIEDLSAWYGEAQVLRDVEPGRSATARSSPWSAATAPARPRCCAASWACTGRPARHRRARRRDLTPAARDDRARLGLGLGPRRPRHLRHAVRRRRT